MATRLHTDDTKGQANWADIDDDDDDWAPESITWKDGTKITIPHVEEHSQTPAAPSPAPSQPPAAAQSIAAKEPENPKSPAPSVLTSKPSLPSGKGIVFSKGAPEKPTLVAKPPAPPTPVKSPWAPIPKVDKAPPVVVEPATLQQGPAKFGPRDVTGPKSATPPPPKEIAADDFSRSPWRDGPGAPNRELFNSQSGRYEPVTDRRGSVRTDQHSRPAALLQRASQHETQGPAEPSAAFQTSRLSEQHNPYGRRRGSSIVSGGSGSYMHLKGQHEHPLVPHEVLSARRESFTAVTDGPRSPVRNFSPSAQHPGQRMPGNQGWQSQVSPASSHSVPHLQPTAAPLPTDPNAGGSAGRSIEEELALQKRLMHEKRELAKKRRQEEEAREEAARKERIRLKLEAMGPAPESRSAKKAATKDEGTAEPSSQQRDAPVPQIQKPSVPDTKTSEPAATSPAMPEGKPEIPINGVPEQPQPPKVPTKDNLEVRPQQQGPPNVSGWPTGPRQHQQFSHNNVWGSPYSDTRSLGNGAFNPELATKHVPGPIAPPSTSRVPSGPTARPAPIAPPGQVPRRPSGPQQRNQMQNAWAAAVQADDVITAQEMRARRDEKAQQLQAEGLDFAAVQAPIKDTWRPTKVDDDGRRRNEKAQQAYHASKAPGWGKSSEPATQPPSSSQARSEYVQQTSAASAPADMSPSAILGATTPQTKGSRFFPSTSRDVRHEATAGTEHRARSSSPSPPPPDMAGHPAFDGDIAHPLVSLPPARPVVRLPPAQSAQVGPAPIAAPQQGQGPSFGWAAPAPYKGPEAASAPSGQTNNWQARIDSLLGVKPSSHAKSVPVDSASRRSLEHPQFAQNATVSLPRGLSKNWPSNNDDSPTTKDQAETCFEEQEMGSLPPVKLPKDTPEAAWHPSASPKPLPKKFWPSVSSAEELRFQSDYSGNGAVIYICAPGMSERKNVTLPLSRNRSNPRRGGRGGRHPSQQYRGGKGREPSASYSNDQMASSAGTSGNRGGRGGYPRRDNWSRHSGPAPIST